MTPKEKAKELVINFSSKLPFYTQKDNLIKSKKCALITVDEIVNAIAFDFENTSENTIYWLRVKQEIEKL